MSLKIIKVRDVTAKLVDERENPSVLNDEEVMDMIKDLMLNDMIDSEGNKCKPDSTTSGNTRVGVLENHFEKFTEAMKHVLPQQLSEIKELIRNSVLREQMLGNLNDIGIDLDNFENYLGSVEVLTIEKVRVYNVYEIKKE